MDEGSTGLRAINHLSAGSLCLHRTQLLLVIIHPPYFYNYFPLLNYPPLIPLHLRQPSIIIPFVCPFNPQHGQSMLRDTHTYTLPHTHTHTEQNGLLIKRAIITQWVLENHLLD